MKKVFVRVTADFTPEGEFAPQCFTWEDGRVYQVDKVFECKKAVSLKAGGQGLRYRCKVRDKEVYIFFENGRWFMEGKDDEIRL